MKTALEQLREFEAYCEAVPRYHAVLEYTPYQALTLWWIGLTDNGRRFFTALARNAAIPGKKK